MDQTLEACRRLAAALLWYAGQHRGAVPTIDIADAVAEAEAIIEREDVTVDFEKGKTS